ncbi:hypothetical protein OHT52_15120 [Streptomyces sp. NBC_00247]|uniref:hypothetical protein n=1 Tax=Streptomyces sp. NBC_00247 TaxID=2975689 RepID=UPI002E28D712|nr:hypothetical protein [Streptomyces sp. NBC_00247]
MERTVADGGCHLPQCGSGRGGPSGEASRTPPGRPCRACADGIARNLAELPALHREIEYALGPTASGRFERVSGSRSVGLELNEEVCAVRAAMLGVLASWAGAVTGPGTGPAPDRAVAPLVAFLLRHMDLLVRHPAAGDLAEEIGGLVADARRVLQPPGTRRIALGSCPRAGCASVVEASASGLDGAPSDDVRCRSGHIWPERELLALRQALSAGGTVPATTGRTLPTRLAARAAGVSEATVRKWASRGKLTRHGSPARAEYDVDELVALAVG